MFHECSAAGHLLLFFDRMTGFGGMGEGMGADHHRDTEAPFTRVGMGRGVEGSLGQATAVCELRLRVRCR